VYGAPVKHVQYTALQRALAQSSHQRYNTHNTPPIPLLSKHQVHTQSASEGNTSRGREFWGREHTGSSGKPDGLVDLGEANIKINHHGSQIVVACRRLHTLTPICQLSSIPPSSNARKIQQMRESQTEEQFNREKPQDKILPASTAPRSRDLPFVQCGCRWT